MANEVIDVTSEISRINEYVEVINKLTISEFGTFCSSTKVKIDTETLHEIRSRLNDLRRFYERAQVDLPFNVRT